MTTLTVGARLQYNFSQNLPILSESDDALPMFPVTWVIHHPSRLLLGLPFSLALMGILLAHEMGHYLYCRRYGVQATLPFFIPAPTLIGTLGAFIRIRSRIRSRDALFDIGIAGPLAGFVVALPVMFVGLLLSHATPAPLTRTLSWDFRSSSNWDATLPARAPATGCPASGKCCCTRLRLRPGWGCLPLLSTCFPAGSWMAGTSFSR